MANSEAPLPSSNPPVEAGTPNPISAARYDSDDFQTIVRLELHDRKFRRGHRLPIVLNHDTPWK